MKYSVSVFFATLIFLVFMSAVNKSSVDKKEEGVLNTKSVAHVALVVKDIEKTTKAYAEVFGIENPKWKMGSNPIYMGKRTEGKAKMAFIKLENITLEIFEPVGGPSVWKDFLDEHGEGVHHFGIWVEGMDEKVKYFQDKDCPVVQNGGGAWGKFNYVDVTPELGVMFELMERASNN